MNQVIQAEKLFKSTEQALFPSCTQVTVVHGHCDSQCISCPIGQANFGDALPSAAQMFANDKHLFMDFEVFKRVADEVALYPKSWLRIHGRGEPLLHPEIVEMVQYAKQQGVETIQCFTDAISLTEKKARALLLAGLDVLECSIHGHEQTYEQLMRNGKFEKVKANVIRYVAIRDELGLKNKLVISAVDQPDFQIDKVQHQAFWSEYADDVIYRPYHSWGNRINYDCAAIPESRHSCAQLWTRCTIGPSGNVLACFNSWDEVEAEVLGNVFAEENAITSIWSSLRYQSIRQDHANGNYSLPCCTKCVDWAGSSWGENTYETLLTKKLRVKME